MTKSSLKLLPEDTKFHAFSFLDKPELSALASTSKFFKQHVDTQKIATEGFIYLEHKNYFAVGEPINLTVRSLFSSSGGYPKQRNISEKEVLNSLSTQKEVKFFSTYAEAEKYRVSISKHNEYGGGFDKTPAIFEVTVDENRTLLAKAKEASVKSNGAWLLGINDDVPQDVTITYYATSRSNISSIISYTLDDIKTSVVQAQNANAKCAIM